VPKPVGDETRYVPALDGIRAVAVLLVMAYHFGIQPVQGGLLGVSIFFTLSGFLITEILLNTYDRTGRLGLSTFWLRRARRLLPALFFLLAVVVITTALAEPEWWEARLHEAGAAAVYLANWATITSDTSYFDRIAGPGPLDHLWSLAIEEQFYLVWPLLLLLLLRLTKGRLVRVAQVTLGLALVSFLLLAVLATAGADNTRAYEGTDTRAGELLVGAALAMLYRPAARRRTLTAPGRLLLDTLGLGSLGVIAWLVATVGPYSMWLYHGALPLLAVATAMLLVSVTHPQSRLALVLGLPPLRWLGERSYGLYLWHMPVAVFAAQDALGDFSVTRLAAQVAVTVVLAAASWHFVEDPIRRHGLFGAFEVRSVLRLRVGRWTPPRLMVGVVTLTLLAPVVLAAVDASSPSPRKELADLQSQLAGGESDAPPISTSISRRDRSTDGHHQRPAVGTDGRPATSCDRVVHVGDSTSVGLMSPTYLPRRQDRVDMQYLRVGVDHVHTDILGARSIVETYHGQPNADTATQRRIAAGYVGCWVFAMGTNDAANQAVGGVVPMDERIDRLMKDIHGQPALWLTLRTQLRTGPWRESQMLAWNAALGRACRRYPNMRVYDWASQVEDSWFGPDGIHFTSTGYAERGRLTADALALAYPRDGDASPTCFVKPDPQWSAPAPPKQPKRAKQPKADRVTPDRRR
jgi:peptidoglycan/LPS O-acetylase OafA/YrhL